MRRYRCEHCRNMRDLGGYPSARGGITAWRRFIRSDAPVLLTQNETAMLRERNIMTVIDLRYPDEAERKPCFLAGEKDFSYYNFSIGSGFVPAEEEEIKHSYMTFVHHQSAMKQVFQTMAKADNGVLFHCSAGKDRTGVVSALLLSLAGVEDCDILADYEVSYPYIRPILRKLRENDPSLPAFAGRSKTEYLEDFLKLFRAEYGCTEDYLMSIGLDRTILHRLKSRLLDESSLPQE
ncbi:Tyrosine-protein phosphatase [Caprobacter fermentans]|uniref:Tyrosine-protein phosphatase n=1 Tax=Caproicibacter fermentans TaxID=2576756 RepID=A0A6N8HYA4_9FIRM|nr:tyrosine-protein phosphatase [Caproicibacter fermentans]MVB10742.1 Tyrosine-protein phosphatase [Caproicibacter fermentans]